MILVTGATGTLGRALIDQLVADGTSVRAVTREPHRADLPAAVEAVAGDPARPETLRPSFDGVTALFLHPRAVGESAAADLLALARDSGVRRVVVLSAINVDDDLSHQPSRYQGDRTKEVEQATVASGLPWVSLRAGSFATNTLLTWAGQLRAGDVVRGPYAAYPEALIHERDLAEVAARALRADDLLGQKLELTGPQALTLAELVTVLGEVLGRPLRYEELPAPAVRQGMVARGFPGAFVDALLARYARGVGRPATVTHDVEKVLGRPALSYREWAADHRQAFGG